MTPTARSRRASASRKFAIGLLSAALLSLLPALALAKKSDRDLPMNYVAKTTNAFNAPNTIGRMKPPRPPIMPTTPPTAPTCRG